MAESSSGASNNEAGELWVCINPGCDLQMPLVIGKQFKFCPGCATGQTQTQTNADVSPPPSGSFTASSESQTIKMEQQQPSGPETPGPTDETSPEHDHLNLAEESRLPGTNGDIEQPIKVSENKSELSQINQPQGPMATDGSDTPQGPMATDGSDTPQGPMATDGSDQPQGPMVTDGSDQPQGPMATDGSDQPQGPMATDGSDTPQGPMATDGSDQPQGPMATDGSDQPQGPMATDGSDQPQGPMATDGSDQPQGPMATDGSDQPQGPMATDGSDQPQGPMVTDGSEQFQRDPHQAPMMKRTLTDQEQPFDSELSGESPKPKRPRQAGHAPNLPMIPDQTEMVKDMPSSPKEVSSSDAALTSQPGKSAAPGTSSEETRQDTSPSNSQEEIGKDDSSEQYEDALSNPPESNTFDDQDVKLVKQEHRQNVQPSGQQQAPQGPLCEHCHKRFLTMDAKICSECGKHKRGTPKPHDTSDLSSEQLQEHPLSGSPDHPLCGAYVRGKPTPANYKYKPEFGVELNSRSNQNQGTPGPNLSQRASDPSNIQTDHLARKPLGSSRKLPITVSDTGPEGSRKRGPVDTNADSDRIPKQAKLEQNQKDPGDDDIANVKKRTEAKEGGSNTSTSAENVSGPPLQGVPHGAVPYNKKNKDEVLLQPIKTAGQSRGPTDKPANKTRTTVSSADLPKAREPHVIPKGFLSPDEKSIKVTFHVILPVHFWGWDSTSKICIQFDNQDLGAWQYNCGIESFKQRDIKPGLSEITCQLTIDAEILKKPVAYKYVIYSPKTKGDKDMPYELIHFPNASYQRDPNRALCISSKKWEQCCGGHYHQYDTIVYPRKATVPKTWGDKAKQKLSSIPGLGGFFAPKTGNQNEVRLEPLGPLQMRIECLYVYLEKYKETLYTGELSGSLSMLPIVDTIQHIFSSLLHCQIWYQYGPLPTSLTLLHKDREEFNKAIKEWIESIIIALQKTDNTDRQLAAAICLTYLIHKLEISFYRVKIEDVSIPLLKLMCLCPVMKTTPPQCPEYDRLSKQLFQKLTPEQRSDIANAILKLCHRIKNRTNAEYGLEWLFGLPLYNLLTENSAPFEDVTLKKNSQLLERWTAVEEKLHLNELRRRTFDCGVKVLDRFYVDLEPLFALDPLALQTFLYICPRAELKTVFGLIPPNVSIAWVSYMIFNLFSNIGPSTAPEWVDWMEVIQSTLLNVCPLGPRNMYALMECSIRLFNRCTIRMCGAEAHCVLVVRASLSLALNAIAMFEKHCPDSAEINKLACKDEAFGLLDEALRKWIDNYHVIGKEMFGGYTAKERTWTGSSIKLARVENEILIWKSLLTAECPVQSVKDHWLRLNKTYLAERVQTVPDDLKLGLLLKIETTSEEHETLMTVVMDAAIKAVDSFLKMPGENMAKKFRELAQHQSKEVGNVLGTILSRKYHHLKDDTGNFQVSLANLLEWYLWPNYLQLYGSDSRVKLGLSQECEIACLCALTKFKEVCSRLRNGDITVNELKMMEKLSKNMERLCEAVTRFSAEEGLSSDALRLTLQQRLREFQTFERHRQMYVKICDWIPSPECVQGIVELKRDLHKDFSETRIIDLCECEGETFRIKHFKAAIPLNDFAEHFLSMMTKRSNLFIRPLETKMKHVLRNNADLTIASIHTLIWKPTFGHCHHLLQSLSDQTIKLADVDKHFRDFDDQLETQVSNLAAGIGECVKMPSIQPTTQLALRRVRNYWKLCEYRDGADVFLNLRDALNLQKGDFKDVEKFSTEFAESMRDQTLADVDDRLIETGQFLEDVAKHPKKKACLESFVRSQNIVEWLRRTTKDVSEIQNFVTVALATAAGGEGDLAHDKLSHLRTVGSGFASFIYNISDQDGYKQLEVKCKSLWEALEDNPKLPKVLEDCNKDLSWYQSARETQGSVEKTSYGQMRNILKYGCYRVGASGTVAVQSVHDLVSMRLEERDKKILKKAYNLDELRDLESKLVLICGNKEESRTEVDHFLNLLHNVTRIAEVFLNLQQAGNVEHSGSILTFPCAQYSGDEKSPVFNEKVGKQLVELLQEHAKQMEEALKDWQVEIQFARTLYYQLNYYTTLQLLTLRREFGRYKAFYSYFVPPNVLALLHSVSPQITNYTIRDAVVRATTEVQPFLIDSSNDFMDENIPLGEIPLARTITESPELAADRSMKPSGVILYGHNVQPPVGKPSSTTTGSFPKAPPKMTPSLTVNDLNDEQKQIFTRLVEFLHHSESHVLRAFQECSPEANKYDIEGWCDRNDDDYSDDDREGEYESGNEEEIQSSASESSDESEPEEVSSKLSDPSASADIDPKPKQRKVSPAIESISPRIKTVIRQAIDRSHPVVQTLLDSEYGLEESIEAVERFGKLGPAMDYLDRKDDSDEGGVFQASSQQPLAENEHIGSSISGSVMGTGKFEDRFTPHLTCDPDASKKHLTLDQLGRALQILNEGSVSTISSQRKFNDTLLKSGHPNLLVTSPDLVLRTALALYVEDMELPLPTPEEVLICNTETTTEEVILLWQRAIFDPGFVRIFCLAHAERLSYQVCDTALRSLSELSQGRKGYRLVIVCSKEDEEKSHIISRLHLHKRSAVPTFDNDDFKQYLVSHFVHCEGELEDHQTNLRDTKVYASAVDPDMSKVRVVSSTRSGMGKSLYIQRLTETLQAMLPSNAVARVTIPIHGPVVIPDMMLDFFEKHMDSDVCIIYHLDIAPSILSEVDTILFSLLILQGLTDSKGRVWRCHPRQLYAVEVTLPEALSGNQNRVTHNQTLELLELLPSVKCISPRNTMMQTEARGIGMDQMEFEGDTIQRVYQYLRRHAAGQDLDHFSFSDRVEGNVQDCLKIILAKCGIWDPSWSEIHHFTKFLNIQLNACELSVFCDETFVGDVMSGLKGFVVKFMIRMSQDFSTPSLEGVVARENADQLVQGEAGDNDLDQYQIIVRRKWEQSSHPYIFFNQDGMSITFVGFMVTQNGDLLDPALGCVMDQAIMRPQLYTGLKQNRVNFDEDYRGWSKAEMIQKIATVMGIEYIHDPDDTYVLTIDNLIKILAIQMRFRCDIPVVIMGETGCGKTRLIRYMCDLARQGLSIRNMLIMKIHGGITDRDVAEFVARAEAVATENKKVNANVDTVVFFDEANTTDSIGLVKEIMCDRRLHGRPISKDLKFIAACNPYRRHTEEMIEKLETAGLGFYVRVSETQQKLGKIPLRQLVYRVLDLPPSMRPLVYDFGQLNTGTEKDYTSQIVKDHVKNHSSLSKEHPNIIDDIAIVLAESQKYMRGRNDECSFVSLRDVERAMIVFEYFYERMEIFAPLIDEKAEDELGESDDEYEDDLSDEDEIQPVASMPVQQIQHPLNIAKALVLAVSVCYHARLQDREAYEDLMARQFQNTLNLPRGAEDFRDVIRWCQEVLLDNMRLGPNIARNAALRENVFMMAICIELRIPLFLVGKPGSSKSLAKSIIQDSMHGKDSQTELLRGFKQVHMFSYQCSQLSTPESVIDVFQQAEKFQSHQDTKQYVSVVVLDEVGLAEDSPNLPLKALHPLLEDGTEGAGKDDQQKTVEREKRVAFIGISNWSLDPAKMNRGVMVTRGDPGLGELKLSASGICSNQVNDPVRERLQDYFDPLSKAYKDICQKQERQFFGLRDFYSLIKMLYWMCERSVGQPLSRPQLEHAIKRNFGGLESSTFSPENIFKTAIDFEDSRRWPDFSAISEKEHPGMNPNCSRLGLIKTSLRTKDTTWHGENRYLLFLTENYAALDILEHYLKVGGDPAKSSSEESMVSQDEVTSQPFVLFGSSFPKDKEYTQICRNINQIKICMETGRTVILLNLENLYESLYDVLNQYYMYYGGVRYVDLGLQTHRVKCRVHENFKLILIAEKNTVYDNFPTPLINRLEKHFVLTSSVLEDWQQEVLRTFHQWILKFSNTRDARGNRFEQAHAFIGYQKDTPAAVVFQATNQLNELLRDGANMSPVWQRLQRIGVLENVCPEQLMKDGDDEVLDEWKEAVMKLGQYLLLQTASEDALFRLQHSKLSEKEIQYVMDVYYHGQEHASIFDFLDYSINQRDYDSNTQIFMQVTTHSHLMSHEEIMEVSQAISVESVSYDLHEFDTELDFSNKIGPAFHREDGESQTFLVIIQCDSGHRNSDLIACARYRIYDEAVRAKNKNRIQNRDSGVTHVLFMIRLPPQEVKSQFVGFQGDPWISVHIDDLRQTSDATVIPEQAINAKLSELFIGVIEEDQQNLPHNHNLLRGTSPQEDDQMSVDDYNQPHEDEPYTDEDEMEDSEEESFHEKSTEDSSEENTVEPLHSIAPDFEHESETKCITSESVIVTSTSDILPITSGLITSETLPITSGPIASETLPITSGPITSETLPITSGLTTSETLPINSGPIISKTLPITSGPITSETLPVTSKSPSEDKLLSSELPLVVPLADADLPEASTHSDVSMSINDKDVDEQQEPDLFELPEPTAMMIESNQFAFHPQHRRLHGCIQASVSALKDPVRDRSKQRLQKLMSLIPKVPEDTLDNSSFYGLLVKLVHSALKDRERDRVDEKDWVVIEAMNARKLHNGGTFRNVLARRIDEVITPFFAEVIATIDRNCNLDLLDNPKNEEPSLSQFWLAMFALVRIDFSSIAQGKTTIEADFHCQMPFSWIVKEVVDGQLANTVVTGSTQRAIYAQACESLRDTELGEVLSEVSEEDCEQFYRLYLNDFVRTVHKSKHKGQLRDMEHKLIADALNEMVHAPELCSIDGHESLTQRVTALHLVYNSCRSEILWFGQLVLHNPGILAPLCATIHHDSMEFNLHLSAVERVLSDLESPLGKDKPADNLSRWLNDVRLSQNVINSVLSLGSQSDAAAQLRLNWQRVRGVQMFVEHVLMPHSDVDVVVTFVRRLDARLSANSDFLKRETLEAVKAQVNNMDKRLKIDKSRKSTIRKSCRSFFMEVVSSLCFGGGQAPEPDLINMLMDTVLFEEQTRELSPYNEPKPDKTPTIRSFLLQLLLEHSPKQVMDYLDDYFKRSCHIIGGSDVDHGLCLLCIQCLEDSLVKECARLPVEHQAQHTIQAAYDSYATLQKCSRSNASVSVGYLEAIAKARYALSVVAENLKVNEVDMDLLHIAHTLCTDRQVNTIDVTGKADTTGPVVYLLKLLVRQFGFPCLKLVSQTHPWVIPQELKRGDDEQHGIDPFVIYQQPYVKLRDAVDTAAYAKEVENLTTDVQTHTDTALLALALYQEVTLSRASTVPAKQLQPEAVEILNDFILNNKMLSPDMRIASRLLLANQQGGALVQMTASPQQPLLLRTLSPIVVHTASIMLCRQKMNILLPFVNIFNNPAALAGVYLPTMQEDFLAEVKKSGIAGTYYECPNGHAYLVGGPGVGNSCPTPQENSACRECGVPIGGMSKNELFAQGNRNARQEDTTNTGHDLGDVTRRQTPQGHERHLSAPAVCIVRAIMHSSFIWASCNNDHTIEALAQLVNPSVLPHHLPEFFWRHLQRDIEDLSTITARGIDECAMIVHLVLSQILTTDPPPSPNVGNVETLHSKVARQKWERLFNVSYIEPVLENLEKKIRKAMGSVAQDNKQEHDQLFYLAYERVKVDVGRLEPHLWSFRSRITVDHLRSSLMQQKKVSVKILDAFLQDEQNLRATQYLPDIVKLQHFLFETFNRRLEKSKAKTQTIREFLRDLKNENTRNEYRERIDSLKKAWALIGQKLAHHKRLPVNAKYLLPAITDDTELEYLIPTTVDEGRCTTSLVDFLVLTHNNFIETCRSLVSSGSSSAVWREHKVPITHIHRCHLLDYEHQLQSIILSHCHYSLTVGKGQDIKYDLPALEKHILNRFIYGKPLILLDIPHVAYRKDVYTAETFLAIRQKVDPQRAIPPRVQQDIITELRTPDRLRETLDVVDIVLGFLSSGGGNPKVTLKKYIESHRMRKKTFSAKAKEYCNLGHVVSLWETISVELARQLWLAGQEPFESIPDNYSRVLTVQDGVNQVTELDKCLRTFDLGLLLGSLFEFIEVHVKHSTAKEEDWALVEAMEFYRDQTGQEQLPQFSAEFPQSITVDQAVATWKHIVLYQEKLRRD